MLWAELSKVPNLELRSKIVFFLNSKALWHGWRMTLSPLTGVSKTSLWKCQRSAHIICSQKFEISSLLMIWNRFDLCFHFFRISIQFFANFDKIFRKLVENPKGFSTLHISDDIFHYQTCDYISIGLIRTFKKLWMKSLKQRSC